MNLQEKKMYELSNVESGEMYVSMSTGDESTTVLDRPWAEALQEMQGVLMRSVASSVRKLVRLFILSSDAARSFVNVYADIPVDGPAAAAGAGGEPCKYHLLMQTLAVPFDCRDKVGKDLLYPEHPKICVLLMATTEQGNGWAPSGITAEAHETEKRYKSEIGVRKPCCQVACDHQRQAGCGSSANLRGKFDSPAGGSITYEACGWNKKGQYNHHRLANFGSATKATTEGLGMSPHALL